MKAGLDDYVLKSPRQIACISAVVRSMLVIAEQRAKTRPVEEPEKASHHNFRALIAAAPAAILALDLVGNVTIWNASAGRLFGWTAPQVLGRLAYPQLPQRGK